MSEKSWRWDWEVRSPDPEFVDYLAAGSGVATAAIALFALRAALRSIRQQTQNSRVEKMADTLMECDTRYGRIREAILRQEAKEPRSRSKLSKHYERTFWALQFEQWNYFRLGLIPQESFTVWVAARCREFADEGDLIFGRTYRTSWENSCLSFSNIPDFVRYMNGMRDRASPKGVKLSETEIENLVADIVEDEVEAARKAYDKFRNNLVHSGNGKPKRNNWFRRMLPKVLSGRT